MEKVRALAAAALASEHPSIDKEKENDQKFFSTKSENETKIDLNRIGALVKTDPGS